LGRVLVAVGLAAALGLAPAANEPAQAATKVKMAQALDSLDFLVLYVARHFNYFAEEGIDLEMIMMSGGGGPNIQAVISGNAQFTPTGLFTALGAIRQQQPLLMVSSLFDALAANVVIRTDVARARGITAQTPLAQKYQALRGLTLGVTRPGALTDQVLKYIVARAGLVAGKDVPIVGVGTGPAALAALEQRKVDGLIHLSPVPEQVVHNGTGVMLFNNSAGEIPELREFLGLALVTTKEYAQKNPDVVRRMNRAILRANAWVLSHTPAETAQILQKYIPGIQPEVMTAVVQNNLRAIPRDGKMRPESILVPQRMQVEVGIVKDVVDWEVFATNAYLP
jgi:NitT/TauT family transport system substrate-binding protein